MKKGTLASASIASYGDASHEDGMSARVTLNVFSGRPNPSWTLSGKQFDDLMDLIRAATTASDRKAGGAMGQLGYRGFSVEGRLPLDTGTVGHPLQLFASGGVVDHGTQFASYLEDQPQIEAFLLASGAAHLDPTVQAHATAAIARQQQLSAGLLNMLAGGCPPCAGAKAPAYNPGKWNVPTVQPYNNCYNYANDQQTNTFAQPGRATGKPITALSCSGVQPSAASDGLVATPNFSSPLPSGWYVALVIWPNQDYHWYRQDSSGCWSHKPGQTAARNTDNAGNTISDPAVADRGPYTTFCTYMSTSSGVKIR